MRSGLVILEPGKSVGMHTTLNNEELIIVLEGEGVAHIAGRDPIKFDKKNAMYIPPQTEHNITSTGSKALRYIYVVSNAE
jgi:mannose-6-phosphate isomerase-like protein (cupin superfamily)